MRIARGVGEKQSVVQMKVKKGEMKRENDLINWTFFSTSYTEAIVLTDVIWQLTSNELAHNLFFCWALLKQYRTIWLGNYLNYLP